MNQIELPELKQLIFKNVDCKNKVEHLIIENHTVDFTWIESNRSYDVIQVQIINILITSNKKIETSEFDYVIYSNPKFSQSNFSQGKVQLKGWIKHPRFRDYSSSEIIDSWDNNFNFK